MVKTIIVSRANALGDVVLTTPVLRRLRRENPDAALHVLTGYPDVYKNNPHVSLLRTLPRGDFSLISLDLAYERQPDRHIVQAYMQVAFGDNGKPEDLTQEMFFPRKRVFAAERRYVAVHAAQAGWSNRTLPRSTWTQVITGLRDHNLWPIVIGAPGDAVTTTATTFHTTDLQLLAQLIANCVCFVGSDSGLLHVAGATETPIVGVYTCADPNTRLPWRQGVLGYKCIAVVPHLACVGCLRRRPPPVTLEDCEFSGTDAHNACVRAVSANAIVDAVLQLVG